jgi:hypothetical protein
MKKRDAKRVRDAALAAVEPPAGAQA